MDGVLSQEEINALLNEPGAEASDSAENELSDAQKDAIGEIANISMGTAATTLFSLVNHKVEISTPVVSYGTWDDIVQEYEKPCVFIRIAYTVGLDGSNILVLREHDVKVITDLMMGGDGTNTDGELGELHLSAISEAMNQMMGSAATSLSSMLNRKIDISPPNATVINLQEDIDEAEIARRRGDDFELDLVLRNNITTGEHPLGVYHPHAKLHHIKKENIGLIEVMGLAVLPARLKDEMAELADALVNGTDLRATETLASHAEWAEGFLPKYDKITKDNVMDILHEEIGLVFNEVLQDAGVYKCTPEGRKAFERFIAAV